MKKVHNETPDTASPLSTEQYKKMLVISLIKMSIPLVLCTVVFCLASVAWFAKNSEVEASGMRVMAQGPNFEISMLENSTNGIFMDHHIKVHEEGSLFWGMTASASLINYQPYANEEQPGDRGIRPGSWGVISFYVTPRVASVDLNFDFEIIGYQVGTDDNGTPEDETDDKLVMTALSELSNNEGDTPQDLLNGHILLFENRTVTTENNVTTITYSDPILSNQDMHRVMNRTISGKDTASLVSIYWVWPYTLSTLVDSRGFTGITTVPFCSGTSYEEIVSNIQTYPQYYLKGAAYGDNITADDISNHYDNYGDMYDQGDNEIGMRVHYILIKLSVEERTAGGGGS